MFVNDLILNAGVKMTEMFAFEKILTTSGNKIYFQTIPSIYIKFVFMFYKYLISILFSIFVFHN
jgi:hypothetical protein